MICLVSPPRGFVVEIRAAVDAAVRVFFGIRWK
jgi:hypothetical protein